MIIRNGNYVKTFLRVLQLASIEIQIISYNLLKMTRYYDEANADLFTIPLQTFLALNYTFSYANITKFKCSIKNPVLFVSTREETKTFRFQVFRSKTKSDNQQIALNNNSLCIPQLENRHPSIPGNFPLDASPEGREDTDGRRGADLGGYEMVREGCRGLGCGGGSATGSR